jgi:catechol 2,3-dioxygenase
LTATALPADSSLIRLALRVKNLEAMVSYYTDVLGLEVVERDGPLVTLAPAGRAFELDLHHEPEAPLRPYPCPGLYHFALVVPDRPALGAIFRRLIDIQEPFEGMADHLVSEALYLRDPEGNGIELYRDRPKDEWTYLPGGGVAMASDPIDSQGILASADAPTTLHPDTRFGHIHLHVYDLIETSSFFEGDLALNRMAELPSALFFAAGDYHHHVGSNTWAPLRPVPPADATGLLSYTWRVPDGRVRDALTDPVGATVFFVG